MVRTKTIPTQMSLTKNHFSALSAILPTVPIIVMIMFSKQPMIGIPFSFFFLLIFFLIISKMGKNDNRFEATYRWKKIQAKVIEKKIIKLICFTIFLKMDKYKMATNSYKIDITYKYDIDGKTYTSNQYALAYKGDADCNYLYTLDKAKRLMHRLTKDKQIDIYVNPDNPEESIIKRGRSSTYGFPYSVFYIVGIALVFFAYKIYWQ